MVDTPGRTASGPVLADDRINGRTVAGFAYAAPLDPDTMITSANDRLLFTDDTTRTAVPGTPVPATATGADRIGRRPAERLPDSHLHDATGLSTDLPDRVEALLVRPAAPWRAIAVPLFDALRAVEHEVWLAGGAVRDLVLGAPADSFKDLDLAGTAPPGRFSEVLYPVLRELGCAESDLKVSPDSLVCWTTPSDADVPALVEYRSLALSGFAFPGTGSDFADDAGHRDMTVNTLYYDRVRHAVVDPTGRGVDDLAGPVRRLVCCRQDRRPRPAAAVVIRGIRFAARWERAGVPVDVDALRSWADGLPPGLWAGLEPEVLDGIRADHDYYLDEVDPADRVRWARTLGPAAAALIGGLSEVPI